MQLKVENVQNKKIQEDMFGLFFEDINYGLDGGLYAELLENRNFEALECRGSFDHYTQFPAYRYGWNSYPASSNVYLEVVEDKPLNQINPHNLRVTAPRAGEGFTNKAYDGIYLKKNVACNITFYARGKAKIRIQILANDGMVLASSEEIVIEDGEFSKYRTEIVPKEDIDAGIFYVCFLTPAVTYFDQFSMIPTDAVRGLFRRDLAERLKALKPGFLRFPGGCVVEGSQLENRYQWKKTVGPVEERKANWNRWAVHENDGKKLDLSPWPYYMQTLGIGFYEYFILCEYLECHAIPVLNVGLACQYHSTQLVPSDSQEFKEYIQDALDLIEFANGSADTGWGALRAQMGHPAPFGLKYIGIGNEQWETEQVDFFYRYACFEKAIHEKYPEINCLGSAGPDVETPRYEAAWEHYTPKLAQNPSYAYAVDEHYYVSDQWLYEHVHMYDKYARENKVFAGEYACHIHPEAPMGGRNTLKAAIAEAAFMTGLEKNADLVLLASYAPLFARIGYTQWQPDMIWFDAKGSYSSPSYYVQQLYSLYTGNTLLEILTDADMEKEGLYTTASMDEKQLYIKLINSSELQMEICIDTNGLAQAKPAAKLIYLTGDSMDVNSMENPERICLRESALTDDSCKLILPAYTAAVWVADRQ